LKNHAESFALAVTGSTRRRDAAIAAAAGHPAYLQVIEKLHE
jgi:hypothetical protein